MVSCRQVKPPTDYQQESKYLFFLPLVELYRSLMRDVQVEQIVC